MRKLRKSDPNPDQNTNPDTDTKPADDLVVANTGTITLRTRWATVTFDSTHGNTVHLTGEVGPFRPTDIGVNWATGPDGTDILVTTDCN
jgi:hypothetical protein